MQCDVCGNPYDRGLEITVEGQSYRFDTFECAIHALAPGCDHCGCKVIGHGTESGGRFYCCEHCAREAAGDHDRAAPR